MSGDSYEVDESWMDGDDSFYADEETEDWTADEEQPQDWEEEPLYEEEDTGRL